MELGQKRFYGLFQRYWCEIHSSKASSSHVEVHPLIDLKCCVPCVKSTLSLEFVGNSISASYHSELDILFCPMPFFHATFFRYIKEN
jgi:hypothetical protein